MLTPVMDNYGLCIKNFRGDIGYHGGWNEGFLTEWWFSLREDLCAASMINKTAEALDRKHGETSFELFQTVEKNAAGTPGKQTLKACCGKYEHPEGAGFCIDEVYTEEGELYAKCVDKDGEITGRLYPIGKKTFGRMGGFDKIVFGDDCLTVGGITCKKL